MSTILPLKTQAARTARLKEYQENGKVLQFTENCPYGMTKPEIATHWGLALIDKKLGTCCNRESNHGDFKKYAYRTHCLEEMGKLFSQAEDKSFVFYGFPDKSKNVAGFISFVESKLKLDKKSEIFATNNPNVTAVRAAPFWLSTASAPLRRRFFLILVRAGQFFDPPYNAASFTKLKTTESPGNYLPSLVGLVDAFLDGYVNFTQEALGVLQYDFHHGILYQFEGMGKQEILDEDPPLLTN